MTAYKPGDKIEASFGGEWQPLGTYVGTTSNGMIVVEQDDGLLNWGRYPSETRLARDTITVTVEIDRADAEVIADMYYNDPVFDTYVDAVTEAVKP